MTSRSVRVVPLVLGAACLVGGIIFVLPSDDGSSGTGLAVYSGFGDSVVTALGWLLIILGVALVAAVFVQARKRTDH